MAEGNTNAKNLIRAPSQTNCDKTEDDREQCSRHGDAGNPDGGITEDDESIKNVDTAIMLCLHLINDAIARGVHFSEAAAILLHCNDVLNTVVENNRSKHDDCQDNTHPIRDQKQTNYDDNDVAIGDDQDTCVRHGEIDNSEGSTTEDDEDVIGDIARSLSMICLDPVTDAIGREVDDLEAAAMLCKCRDVFNTVVYLTNIQTNKRDDCHGNKPINVRHGERGDHERSIIDEDEDLVKLIADIMLCLRRMEEAFASAAGDRESATIRRQYRDALNTVGKIDTNKHDNNPPSEQKQTNCDDKDVEPDDRDTCVQHGYTDTPEDSIIEDDEDINTAIAAIMLCSDRIKDALAMGVHDREAVTILCQYRVALNSVGKIDTNKHNEETGNPEDIIYNEYIMKVGMALMICLDQMNDALVRGVDDKEASAILRQYRDVLNNMENIITTHPWPIDPKRVMKTGFNKIRDSTLSLFLLSLVLEYPAVFTPTRDINVKFGRITSTIKPLDIAVRLDMRRKNRANLLSEPAVDEISGTVLSNLAIVLELFIPKWFFTSTMMDIERVH